MKHGINIQGGKVEREAVQALSDAIADIFASAAETRMEQATVVRALDVLQNLASVSDVSVSHCSVVQGQ